MAIELIENIDRFRQLEPEWNETLERSRNPGPFMTFEWLLAYLETYGDDISPFVIVARHDSKIVALAPLMIDGDRQLVFIGYPHNDYADFIVADDHPTGLNEICEYLRANRSRWSRIVLDQMHGELSHWKELIERLERLRWPHRLVNSDSCSAMILEDFEAARKQYYKRNIRKFINWYKRQGEFAFNVYADRETALARLEDVFRQHIDRRDETPFVSQFTDESTRQFYHAFVGRLHDKSWVRLMSLTLDDEFLALYITFEYNRTLYLYTTTFNSAYAQHSPGQTFMRFLFDYAVENGLDQLDLARGDEVFKDRFANTKRYNRRLIVYNGALARLGASLFHAFRHSWLVDMLYRNKRVQSAKLTFLFVRRKHGLIKGVTTALRVLLAPARRKGDRG